MIMKVGTRIGGKGRVFRQLISLMPPHEVYIEPFLGGGSVMLHKKPDRDSDAEAAKAAGVKFWRIKN